MTRTAAYAKEKRARRDGLPAPEPGDAEDAAWRTMGDVETLLERLAPFQNDEPDSERVPLWDRAADGLDAALNALRELTAEQERTSRERARALGLE